MFHITPAASAHLAQVLATAETPEESDPVIRIFMGQDGLGLRLDLTQPGDTGYDHDGTTVLVVDDQLLSALEGRTLDTETTEQGESLMLR